MTEPLMSFEQFNKNIHVFYSRCIRGIQIVITIFVAILITGRKR